MCLTSPATVFAVDADGATVDVAGRRLRASTLLEPDVRPGDRVLIAAGTILRRLSSVDAAELEAAWRLATDPTADPLPSPDPAPEVP